MGLGKDERYNGVMHCVEKLAKIGEGTPVEKFTSKLWHALLRKNNNSCHWVFGSASAGNVKLDGASVWERAICSHTEDINNKDDEDSGVFDATKNFSIDLLVRYGEGKLCETHKKMFEIYEWTENIIYYLRRYDDEMPNKDFADLDKLISDIQGECFSYFKDNEVFAKAYIVNKIIGHIYHGTYPFQKDKWNVLVQWLAKNNVHHDLNRCMEMDLIDLAKIHMDLVNDLSIKNKAITVGKIMLRRLHNYRDDPFLKKYVTKDMFAVSLS